MLAGMSTERLRPLTCRHKNTANNQKLLVVSAEHTQKHKHNASTSHDTKTNSETADADINRVMAVDIERLGWPEHNHREEIGTGDEGDHERQAKSSRFLLQAGREDWIFRSVDLPECEGDQQEEANDQWRKNVG